MSNEGDERLMVVVVAVDVVVIDRGLEMMMNE